MRRRQIHTGLLLCLLFLPPSPATIARAAPADPTPADSAKAANPSGRARPPRIFNAVRLQGPAPNIDGRFDDAAWNEGAWSGDYIQQLPVEGAAPSVKTELKILYDDRNVYIAIRAQGYGVVAQLQVVDGKLRLWVWSQPGGVPPTHDIELTPLG